MAALHVMRFKKKFSAMILALGFALAVYLCGYFLAADYVDVGDQRPMYLLSYRIGSHNNCLAHLQ
ncbi:MAG: hypothetical protein QOF48_231 [Verrucomicrobiota bacterium]|jgi:hypothetical protein